MSDLRLDDFRKCPQLYCGQPINIVSWETKDGNGFFVCPECDSPAVMRTDGQLATEEEYEEALSAMCEVAGE